MEIHLYDVENFISNLNTIYWFSVTVFKLLVVFVVEILVDSKNHMASSVDTLQSLLTF
jgi:hypothetical protein